MRRKALGIALFSFQDIVTAVTSILILVLLILTLEFLLRKYSEAAVDVAAARADLDNTVAMLERTATAVREQVQQARSSTGINESEAELRRHVVILEARLEEVDQRIVDAKHIRRAVRRQHAERARAFQAKRDEVKDIAAMERDLQVSLEQIVAMSERNAATLNEIEELRKKVPTEAVVGTEIVFNKPVGSDKQPWIIEVASGRCTVLKLGEGTILRFDAGDDEVPPSLKAWLGTLDRGIDYVLMLIRPSGEPRYRALRSLLESASIPFGLDVIGESQAIRQGGKAKAGE